jgi:hypothetical protein
MKKSIKIIGDGMKRNILGVIFTIIALLLSGCMYPKEELAQNKIPYKDQIQAVQTAVDQYRQENGGLLPIKTKEAETPIYQKYLIDFKKISPKYLAEPPGNAFESGGVFQYVLIDVETAPTVKVFDLRIAETIRELNLRIKSTGYPPYKAEVAKNVYTLDYKQLGYKKPPVAVSPYSNQNLSFVITTHAEVYVDYRPDLFQALKNTESNPKPGEDIRHILVKDSMFVPAYSLPYTVDSETNEPVFIED